MVAHWDGEKHQAANTVPRLRTDGEETSDLVHDVSECNVKIKKETENDIPYVHVITECDIGKEPITF